MRLKWFKPRSKHSNTKSSILKLSESQMHQRFWPWKGNLPVRSTHLCLIQNLMDLILQARTEGRQSAMDDWEEEKAEFEKQIRS